VPRRKRYALTVRHHVWQAREPDGERMLTGADFARLFADVACADREMFFTVTLNPRNEVIDRYLTSMGTLTASLVHPREAFKAAVMDSACSVAFVHNHPSGNPTPSMVDRELSDRLKRCAELLGIRYIDFVVVARDGYTSFAECGWM